MTFPFSFTSNYAERDAAKLRKAKAAASLSGVLCGDSRRAPSAGRPLLS